MIGALPGIDHGLEIRGLPLIVDLGMPLAARALVDDVLLNELPHIGGDLEILLAAVALLVAVHEADDGFRLYPPNTPGVYLILVALVEQGAGSLVVCYVSYIADDTLVHLSELCGKLRVADDLGGAVDEPCRLDIVTVGVDIADNVQLSVEENKELVVFAVEDIVFGDVKEELQP